MKVAASFTLDHIAIARIANEGGSNKSKFVEDCIKAYGTPQAFPTRQLFAVLLQRDDVDEFLKKELLNRLNQS